MPARTLHRAAGPGPRPGPAVRLAAGRDRCGQAAAGFTLVELLVALAVFAAMAGLAWQGLDGLMRAESQGRRRLEATAQLQAALGQWDADLAAAQDSGVVPALRFDGASLRLTRRQDEGLQLVVWQRRDGIWWRWASAPLRRREALQSAWLASLQLQGQEAGWLAMLPGLAGWQVYVWRGEAWVNPQSSAAPTRSGSARATELPEGVRLQIDLLPTPDRAGGRLERDRVLLVPGLP